MQNNDLINEILKTAELFKNSPEFSEYELDYSDISVEALDDLIEDFWGGDGPSEKNRDTMVWAVGCYLAALIDHNFNGDWYRDDETNEVTFEPEVSEIGINPFTWIAKRFSNGELLTPKYEKAIDLLSADRK